MSAPTSTLVMTGASRGLGRVAAEHLLRERPDQHLVVTARGRKGRSLAGELARATGNPNVSVVPCDLTALDEVRTAVSEIRRRLDTGELPPLRGFLGNAGLQMATRTRASADGFEVTFAVNVLANYLFLRLLFDGFAGSSRIIVVGSDAHFGGLRHNLGMVPAPRWDDVRTLATPGTGPGAASVSEGRRAYSTSKLGVVYLVHAFARRLPPGVDVYTYNPGLVPGTGLARDAGPISRALWRTLLQGLRAAPFATGPDAAGRLLADAMAGPRPGESGSYIDRGTVIRSSAESYDPAREEALWATAAELCGLPAEQAAAR
ncbi:SDR family NAD(P)-dependent oxidoreductase [Nocardia aurea]|uniref:SDR family NAD(P)-dependent oxidoreductase n=1 Tax=Nocardia aurea TaxID=2144174 RepID=UPI000D69970B|nr:SDR family NAD(P)-dependent oxidoreductase [Nocardia aurea]